MLHRSLPDPSKFQTYAASSDKFNYSCKLELVSYLMRHGHFTAFLIAGNSILQDFFHSLLDEFFFISCILNLLQCLFTSSLKIPVMSILHFYDNTCLILCLNHNIAVAISCFTVREDCPLLFQSKNSKQNSVEKVFLQTALPGNQLYNVH